LGIPVEAIDSYERIVNTHIHPALIPLFEERYDLVLPREQEVILASLLNYI